MVDIVFVKAHKQYIGECNLVHADTALPWNRRQYVEHLLGQRHHMSKMRNPVILVIEDNETEQYVLRQLLERYDYNVDVVCSGEEALSALGIAKYAAVLMDITLPGMDGYECTQQIRRMELEIGRHTPIIALTARAQQSDHDACDAAGMDDYLSKPFEPEELRKLLLRWVYDPTNPNLKVLPEYPRLPREDQKSP
jgi:CheY-like chemotaxis protein